MSDHYLGEIRLFAGKNPPRGFAFCNGQLIPIVAYTDLFSILGTRYGGDGKSTFALRNRLGCLPMHFNNDALPDRSTREQGESVGVSVITLTPDQLPGHSHPVSAVKASAKQIQPSPATYLASAPGGRGQKDDPVYAPAGTASFPLDHETVMSSGGGQPMDIRQPYRALNFINALDGIYPPRP